jgi:hypothetical protein
MRLQTSVRHSGARAQRVNPESRNKRSANIWIPDRLASLGIRNDGRCEGEPA